MSKRFFVTGHSGFKGAWLTFMLKSLGHEVSGYSDTVRPHGLHHRAGLSRMFEHEFISDVRDFDALTKALAVSEPDVVIHMAAQPLVLQGYRDPHHTFDVNFNGTLNCVEASIRAGVQQLLVITTDKVYKDDGRSFAYSEDDELGGFDPYAASKSAADILTQSYMMAIDSGVQIDVARGGNVIGGGDDSSNRIIPDIERSISEQIPFGLRNPGQVRPWQHALDCLDGYLEIISKSVSKGEVWNIGPLATDEAIDTLSFSEIYREAREAHFEILNEAPQGPKETKTLLLNSEKAQNQLSWRPKWSSREAIRETAHWHREVEKGKDVFEVTLSQVERYLARDR